jgi:hypothetical protein
MTPHEAGGTFEYLIKKGDYKDCPDVLKTFQYALSVIERAGDEKGI